MRWLRVSPMQGTDRTSRAGAEGARPGRSRRPALRAQPPTFGVSERAPPDRSRPRAGHVFREVSPGSGRVRPACPPRKRAGGARGGAQPRGHGGLGVWRRRGCGHGAAGCTGVCPRRSPGTRRPHGWALPWSPGGGRCALCQPRHARSFLARRKAGSVPDQTPACFWLMFWPHLKLMRFY